MSGQQNKLYGRKFELTILNVPEGAEKVSDIDVITIKQEDFKQESLRVIFDVSYVGFQAFYVTEITIYNLTGPVEQKLIKEGAAVELKAGYQNGPYGKIFSGNVFQSVFEREDVTDWKLTLRCIDGYKLFDDKICNFTLLPEYTQMTLVNEIISRSQIPVEKITPDLNSRPHSRSTTILGNPASRLREIMRWGDVDVSANSFFFVKDKKLCVGKITDDVQGEPIVISPGMGGLIGTPVHIEYGVSFRCLLNPGLELTYPFKTVKLDMTSVLQQKAQQGRYTSLLDQSGEFIISGVRHIGDTRGNIWYSDVTGLNRGGKIPLQLIEGATIPGNLPEMIKSKKESVN